MNLSLQLTHDTPMTVSSMAISTNIYSIGDIFIIEREPYILANVDNSFCHLVCLYDGVIWAAEELELQRNKRVCQHPYVYEYDLEHYMSPYESYDWYYYGRFINDEINVEELED